MLTDGSERVVVFNQRDVVETNRRGMVQGSQRSLDAALAEGLAVLWGQAEDGAVVEVRQAQSQAAGLCTEVISQLGFQVAQSDDRFE